MRISYGGVSMGLLGWFIIGPILLIFAAFAGFIRMLTATNHRRRY